MNRSTSGDETRGRHTGDRNRAPAAAWLCHARLRGRGGLQGRSGRHALHRRAGRPLPGMEVVYRDGSTWNVLGFGYFCIADKQTDACLGHSALLQPPEWPDREVGYTLARGAHGKGYAIEAASAVLRFAYEHMGWTTAVSVIDPQNRASQNVRPQNGGVAGTRKRTGLGLPRRYLASPAAGTFSRIVTAISKNQANQEGQENGTENPSRPCGLQETALLPHRHRRRAQPARRPLHRAGRFLEPDAAEGRRTHHAEGRAHQALARCRRAADRPRRTFPRCRRLPEARSAQQPDQGAARQEGAGAHRRAEDEGRGSQGRCRGCRRRSCRSRSRRC